MKYCRVDMWSAEVEFQEIIRHCTVRDSMEEQVVNYLKSHILGVRIYRVWNAAFFTLSGDTDEAMKAVFGLMSSQIDYVIKNWKDKAETGLCQGLLVNSLLSSGQGVILNFHYAVIGKVDHVIVEIATCQQLTKQELMNFTERKNNHVFALILLLCKLSFTKNHLQELREMGVFDIASPASTAFSINFISSLLSAERIEHELVLSEVTKLSLLDCVVMTPPSEGVRRSGSIGTALNQVDDDYLRESTPKPVVVKRSLSAADFTPISQNSPTPDGEGYALT